MKPFQQFFLAPAALGLLSPLAVQAADLNLAGVNRYAEAEVVDGQEQVTSINQFSDVRPTDWAYQALSNLIERYGCVAGYPNGTYKGGQAMTRYEAAALLNACLDRITEVTDELKRLMKEFEKELAVLRGRVDGLEAKVGELEATQFSTTTKLSGDTVFVLGANSFGGSENLGDRSPDENSKNFGATVFNYDVRLNLSTSFTGKDLLYTRLRSGDFNNSPFSGKPFSLMALDRAFSPSAGPGAVEIDRLYYRFPIGSSFTALIGGRARNTEFLAIRPSFYGGRGTNILDVFTLHGAPGTYNKATGAAFGLMWKQNVKKGNPYFAASTSYIGPSGNEGNPEKGGLFTDGSKGSFTTQIGVAAPQWALAFAWRYGQCGQNFRRGSQFANQNQPCPASGSDDSAYSNNFAVTAAWQPIDSGWVPSISAGWGYNSLTQAGSSEGFDAANNIDASQSWSVGLEWADVFAKGNALGMAVGQPVFATSLRDGNTPQDGNYVWEWWYKFQVTDNISVTPAIFYLSRPDGQFTTSGETNHVFGGLVQTQFKF
ncbi:iron uptake porin [Synechococcus sp. CS-1328]|uniref:iron uptake porin n=1 Tax=Synechococcus sp. CS-1328 TaxID=2847976 RepID=UPI0021E31B0D|nr:iron uptake porin [Synechococcus sp. CS-1328]MCT0224641.1 iron uptake porin [Synechococcus sp. CS-1328]